MSKLSINTTQNVNINFNTANPGERLLAFVIDLCIFIVYITVVFVSINLTGLGKYLDTIDRIGQAAIQSIIFLPVMFYSLYMETLFEGQSIGKRALKIKVIKIDGYQAGFSDYLIRWLFRIIECNFFLIGLITMLVNKGSRRVGDLAAGTAVISLKNDIKISHTILRELATDYLPTYPTVINLSDNDVRIIKETYDSAYKAADFETIGRLQNRIMQVAGISVVSQSPTAFVDTVMKDYNYYTQHM